MSVFAKFTIKSVVRRVSLTPTEARRQKLVSAINEQLVAAEAASRGEPRPGGSLEIVGGRTPARG